jgi:hypothetical protein
LANQSSGSSTTSEAETPGADHGGSSLRDASSKGQGISQEFLGLLTKACKDAFLFSRSYALGLLTLPLTECRRLEFLTKLLDGLTSARGHVVHVASRKSIKLTRK